MSPRHIPVMVEEVVSLLGCGPHRVYVDATLGCGGHALEILKQTGPDGKVIGVEWDEEAIGEAVQVLRPFGERVKILRENFTALPDRLMEMNIGAVDGILLDLGLSSIQVDRQERGFSFKGEGPLDMRMDQRADITASDLVNELSSQEMKEIFRKYGEERWAGRIARALVKARDQEPVTTTQSLRRIVCQAIPRRYHSRRIDPATRTFQALRIEVNHELENLQTILDKGWPLLKKGGRMCVISFHSLEDRMVKQTFRRLEKERPGTPDSTGVMKVITPKPVVPPDQEQEQNPRSRSAKLRCAERI